ncbi:major cardiolipin synthase ClsA [Dictyobacter alpinus]|uniref:Major cardiolipin synthase ClsA n=1 Tax=Dictyobacter alpinus TaxID=2014873 RepID=A0A402BAC7_9CHLR|nr:phospholipase D-like domain-containing protein [Dictyobacter alpinus]GCE28266.1 major cardiolipin synthase ClsA [Dictyobacter alpinus]
MRARLSWIPVSRLLRWLLAALFVPPTIVSIVLVLVDSVRKHGRSQGHFLSLRNEPPVAVDDSEVQLYTYGSDLYQAMLADIKQAQTRIFFETFIWKDDVVGNKFKDALVQAARRGVDVYIIYDQFANLVVSSSLFQFDPTIHVLRYPFISFPFRPFTLKTYARDHRKVLVIDDHIGYIGGYNIGALYARKWRDTHARIKGPGTLEIENTFIDFWNEHKKRRQPELPDLAKRDWNADLVVQRNDPTLLMFPIRSMYLETIDRAQKSFYLTNAYFIPDRAILHSLLKAAHRGVDVRVLVPAKSNHIIADWLSHGFYTQCLKGGIRLLLYSDAMIHAKTATADRVWSTVGTANLDRLSMVGNFELNIEFYSPAVAQQMEKIFEYDSSQAYELTLAQWEHRPFYWKIAEYLLSTFRPLF